MTEVLFVINCCSSFAALFSDCFLMNCSVVVKRLLLCTSLSITPFIFASMCWSPGLNLLLVNSLEIYF